MQSSRGIVKSILISIICFYLLTTIVCASGINDTLTIPRNISSSPLEKITAIPITYSTQTPSPEIHRDTTPVPIITTSPTTKSSVSPVTNNYQRLAPLNPDFIAYKNNIPGKNDAVLQKSLLVSEIGQHGLGFIPPTTNLSYTKGQDVTEYIRSNPVSDFFPFAGGQYPSFFDLRTLSKVTPVRDQGGAGSCWAFATYASLESYLLPGESWNFSENNMKNLLSSAYPEGFDRFPSGGGNARMSTAYLTRWTGPISEADDPYDDDSTTSPTDIPAIKHVQNVMFLPDRANATDNNNIKSALTTHGVVYTSMYIDFSGDYYNGTNFAYYYPYFTEYANHAVGIVGWDDNYSRNNFTIIPPADGAFIIKNSWGTEFGDLGYFYISYYDPKIGKYNAVFTAENAQNYDTIYQYDPLGWVGSFGGINHTQWGANVFTSNSSETLSAVSFYAVDTNTSYELYIYKNPDDGPVNTTGYSYRQEGIISGPPGYYTKVISPGIILQDNDTFSVVVNLTTHNTLYPLPVEYAAGGYSSQATAHTSESYFSDDGGQTWSDITEIDPTENICIKAFTIFTPLTAAFSANVTSGHAPLTVEFTDNSTGSPTAWNWSFGDGTYNTTQNPVHTFTVGGAYTVTLNVTNAHGMGTLTRPDYIIVNGEKIGIFRNSTGDWKLDYNNTGVVDTVFHFGTTGDIPITGDWNGDSISDIGVFRPSASQFIFNTSPVTRITWGLSTDIPITGDWNGDSISDIGVFRPSVRQFIFNTSPVTRITWGLSTDIPITGDWNGDGISDIGVFRPSVRQFIFNTTPVTRINYGLSTDIPLGGDWDGDGISDIGVFRPSTRQFILDLNNDGIADKRVTFGLYTDIPVIGKWI